MLIERALSAGALCEFCLHGFGTLCGGLSIDSVYVLLAVWLSGCSPDGWPAARMAGWLDSCLKGWLDGWLAGC